MHCNAHEDNLEHIARLYLVMACQNHYDCIYLLRDFQNDCGNVCCTTIDCVCKQVQLPWYPSFLQFVLDPVLVSTDAWVNVHTCTL